MGRIKFLVLFAVATSTLASSASRSLAYWHAWRISEIYSNADGSVQFIEMFTNLDGEWYATTGPRGEFTNWPTYLKTSTHSYQFDHDLTTAIRTANNTILIATAGFESLPNLPQPPNAQVVPDYIIPSNFFNPASDTITFCTMGCLGNNIFEVKPINNLPTDGITSTHYPFQSLPPSPPGTEGVNSPKNFLSATGQLDLSIPPPDGNGDYNNDGRVDAGDYVRWRNNLGDADETNLNFQGDGGDVSIDDYLYWKERYGDIIEEGAGGIASPEPATLAMALATILTLVAGTGRMRWR